MRRNAAIATGVAGATAAAAGAAYALHRRAVGGEDHEEDAARRALPADTSHHRVAVTDGGRIHVAERGSGPPVVLVHGVTLGVAVWARQLRHLAGSHRVLAVGQRGHGESSAGSGGYSFERMGRDLLEVLAATGVRDAVLVGHSMGGMVVQELAIRHPRELAAHVGGLVLVATSPGPLAPGPLGPAAARALTAGGRAGLRRAGRLGHGTLPQRDLAAWAVRWNFGSRPRHTDLELVRSMVTSMSPEAMAELLRPLLSFDMRREVGAIDLPTRVVVGSRDLLTPARASRAMAALIPGATCTVLEGCGHMVMLERADELEHLVHDLSLGVAGSPDRR